MDNQWLTAINHYNPRDEILIRFRLKLIDCTRNKRMQDSVKLQKKNKDFYTNI